MAKKEVIPYKELSEQEIMMVVPNNVTFGQYEISELQENILTLIGDALQKHMTKEHELPRDLFNQPYVQITCDEASGKNNKSAVKAAACSLTEKRFVFKWRHPQRGNEFETAGTIVSSVHDEKNTNRLYINFNIWAIPFLIYYGIGVGGTRYNKAIALKIRGNYAKRIYKMLCSQRDRNEYVYSIEQFKIDLGIPEKYKPAEIARSILYPAKERIKESGSDVWFEYEMKSLRPKKGRKPESDTIFFYIKTLHPKQAGGEQYQQYAYVYRWIHEAMGRPSNTSALDATEKITSAGRLKHVYERISYYEERIATGQQTTPHVHNSILKMLREDFKIDAKTEPQRKSDKHRQKEQQKQLTQRRKEEASKTQQPKTLGALLEGLVND